MCVCRYRLSCPCGVSYWLNKPWFLTEENTFFYNSTSPFIFREMPMPITSSREEGGLPTTARENLDRSIGDLQLARMNTDWSSLASTHLVQYAKGSLARARTHTHVEENKQMTVASLGPDHPSYTMRGGEIPKKFSPSLLPWFFTSWKILRRLHDSSPFSYMVNLVLPVYE